MGAIGTATGLRVNRLMRFRRVSADLAKQPAEQVGDSVPSPAAAERIAPPAPSS
jgi:hypothetical protein